MLVSEISTVRQDAICELQQRHVIVICNDKVKFDNSFLALVADEIVRIFYANLGHEDVLADLRKNRAKTARLAICNVLSRLFKDILGVDVLHESMKFLDRMIVEAFL